MNSPLQANRKFERKEEIIRRQEAVSELAPELKFRQRFRILGLLYKGKASGFLLLRRCRGKIKGTVFS